MVKIIFGGGAWKLFYILGVIKFLQENINPNNYKDIEYHGASAGSWGACIMALNIDYKNVYNLWLNKCIQNRKKKKIYNIINTNSILKDTFKILDINENNIEKISKHVVIYTTNILLKQIKHKNINNKLDLYNLLMGSTYVPFFTSKKIPKFKKKILLDGDIRRIPYDLKKDIYISTSNKGINNKHDISPSSRLSRILSYLPPSKKYNLKLFNMGYKDAHKLLDNPKFIPLI
jgi:hypothetical protein